MFTDIKGKLLLVGGVVMLLYLEMVPPDGSL